MKMLNLSQILPNKKCLIVDGRVESRAMMKHSLEKFGARDVQIALDGDSGTRMIADSKFDLIIADFDLGRGKDGQQVLEESRFSNSLPYTSCFIMLSADNASDVVMGAIENSPDDFISKPFNMIGFEERLSRALTVKDLLKDIEAYIDKHDHQEAIELCRKLAEQNNPIQFRVLRLLAEQLIKTEQYDQAKLVYEQVLEQQDINWAKLGLAVCISNLGDIRGAERLLFTIIDRFPLYAQCYDMLAELYLDEERYDDAIRYMELAAEKSPRSVLRQMRLGKLAYERKQFELAEKAFKRAVTMGRHSCYLDVTTFKQYIDTLHKKITEQNTRESNLATEEALKASAVLKLRFEHDVGCLFDAELLDARTFIKRGHKDEAINASQNAEQLMTAMPKIGVEDKLKLADTLIDTDQSEKAKSHLSELPKELKGHNKKLEKIKQKQQLKERQKADEIAQEQVHELAVKLYKEKQFRAAMTAFDSLVVEAKASESVLLNALQSKIAVIEDEGKTKQLIKEAKNLVKKIGKLKPGNPRFERYRTLVEKCQSLQPV